MIKQLPSIDFLFDRFYVDSTSPTGLRYAKDLPRQAKARKDMVAGTLGSAGYFMVRVDGNLFLAHRIVHAMRCGHDNPQLTVDHKDRRRSNNHPFNLRWLDPSGQERNKPTRGALLRGVTLLKDRPNPYQAQATVNGVKTYLGCYATEQEAHQAYLNHLSKELDQ